MRCPNCKAKVQTNSRFCGKCGAPLPNQTTVAVGMATKPKSKNAKIWIVFVILFVFLGVFALAITVTIHAQKNISHGESSGTVEQNHFDFLHYDTGLSMSDDLFDFQVKIGEAVYQFPMTIEAFEKGGAVIEKDPDELKQMTDSGSRSTIWFTYPDGSELALKAVNFSKSQQPLSSNYLVGVDISSNTSISSDLKFDPSSNVQFAKGITLGKSTSDEVIEAYGNYSYILDTTRTILVYTKDVYATFQFVFEDDVLTEVQIENSICPADFDDSPLVPNTPDLISQYQRPAALGSSICSGVFELDGDLYKLPVPLKAFLENGWKVTEKSADTVAAGSCEYITLTKDGIEIKSLIVENEEKYEVPIENSVIEDFSSSRLSEKNADVFNLPGNLNANTPVAELVQKLLAAGATIEKDSGFSEVYHIKGDGCQLYVAIDDNAVVYMTIMASNDE